MWGERVLAVRVQAQPQGGWQLTHACAGVAAEVKSWHRAGVFANSQPVLVLPCSQRHVLTLDRPEVPPEELLSSLRWPLGEALEVEPDTLLCSVTPLPQINETGRRQVLAVAAKLELVREQLSRLGDAGVQVRHVDTVDSTLSGMAALAPANADGWIMLAFVGGELCIGLVWRGQFCTLRTLALPQRSLRGPNEFEDHLALHVQRTADLFERQATRMAVRHVLASLPSLPAESRERALASLPAGTQWLDLATALTPPAPVAELCAADDELSALVCVAVSRLQQAGTQPEAWKEAA